MKKNKNAISTRLSFIEGTVTRIVNRGNSRTDKEFRCLLEIKGMDPDFLTDAVYEFRSRLENADLYGEFFGIRRMSQEDAYGDFCQPTEYGYQVAMLFIYADKLDLPLVKRLYKQWDLELKGAFKTIEKF